MWAVSGLALCSALALLAVASFMLRGRLRSSYVLVAGIGFSVAFVAAISRIYLVAAIAASLCAPRDPQCLSTYMASGSALESIGLAVAGFALLMYAATAPRGQS
jgi:hypothetical protein